MAKVVRKPQNVKSPWTVRYTVGHKQRERSFGLKRDADAFLAKYEHDSRLNICADPTAGPTFTEAAEAWIDRLDCAANTSRGYRSRLRKHIARPWVTASWAMWQWAATACATSSHRLPPASVTSSPPSSSAP